MLNIEAAIVLTASYKQARAYIKKYSVKLKIKRDEEIKTTFEIGEATSIGTIDINSPIGYICFYIVYASISFLLYLQNINKLDIYFNNLIDELIAQNRHYFIVRKFEYPFYIWGKYAINFFTESELRRFYKRFEYLSVDRLARILGRAGYKNEKHRSILAKIKNYCIYY